MTGIGYGIVRLGSVVCSSWQSFLQERPYATAYRPFSVRESCTSNPNPPSIKNSLFKDIDCIEKEDFSEDYAVQCAINNFRHWP